MMNQSLFLLALAGLAVSAEGQIGDFRWGRWLLDPAAPLPQAMPLDPTQAENATLLSGNAQAGTLSLLGWQGTNQAGTISFSGNVFLAPPGTTWWIGAPQWDIQRGTRNATTGQWTYARRMFQDWRIHMGYCARPAAELSAAHGSPSRIGHNTLGVDAIVLELDGRWTSNTSTGWTTSYYRGNPPNCGVWAVPAGQSINSAQANLANRLADVTSAFAGFTPGNGLWAVDFRVGANGSWTLAIDKNGDQTAEVTVASSDAGRLPSPFTSISGQSGLMLSVEASAANGMGQVGRTPISLRFHRNAGLPTIPDIQTIPAAGLYNEPQRIYATAQANADIYYTIDASEPTRQSQIYPTGGLLVNKATTLRLRAFQDGWNPSTIRNADYTFQASVPTPSVPGGTYSQSQNISLSTATPEGMIYYTIDGSDPNLSSSATLANGVIQIDHPIALKAVCKRPGWIESSIMSEVYAFQVPGISISPPEGNYQNIITISAPNNGVQIRYTLDGSEPSSTSAVLADTGLLLDHDATIRAKGFRADWQASPEVVQAYTFQTAAVIAEPPMATGPSPLMVILTSPTVGADIYYTIDGSSPISSDSLILYSNPISITSTRKVRFYAGKTGWQRSAEGEGNYTIINPTEQKFRAASIMIAEPPFNEFLWNSDAAYRAKYITDPRPGRVWQVSQAEGSIELFTRELYSTESHTVVTLIIKGPAGYPLNAVIIDSGQFDEGANVGTWIFDGSGQALINMKIMGKSSRILASSPKCNNILTITFSGE